MTDNTSDPLPLGMVEAIGKTADHNKSTVLHDPRPHSQRLGDGMFKAAASYASAYKQRHPEASGQITRIAAFAFKPKPAGYTEYIDRQIARWLSRADTETNTATVRRIRDRFPNHSFADSLLNKPLSKGRCEKIAANAAQLGFKIDTRKYDTLSKIKAAARKGALGTVADRHINIDLPPSEWSIIYVILDTKGNEECHSRNTRRRRLSASCVRPRLCWRRAGRQRMRAGGCRSASRPITVGARSMAV